MTLHDTDALIIETDPADLTPTLPDPTTVSGRTHDLSSNAPSAAVWGSTGATPFSVDGAAVATLTVPRGTSLRVQSDGTRWVLLRPFGARRFVAAKGATDASGNVTFNFTPPFATVPVVVNAVETATTDGTETRITAISASSVTFNARRSPAVTVLGISVLSAPQPAVGFIVHAVAVEAG
ncbi:hypothetical protein SEA_MISCHIEF19_22 [Streptomyces phage Mischief19]|nr:hypothetical protein SEA_MISCHIEF19_22 [Streptomyces phage Mischief19]